MPKRSDIHTVLVIGAGPIVIGQACEFDYSGVQAIKALKAEGYRVVLVNSNPATIMTDPDLADATYVEPITPEFVEKIIALERPACPGVFALLPTMGGQTALNTALALYHSGALARYDVEMIGAKPDAIEKAEDRAKFRTAMDKIGLESPRARIAAAPELRDASGKVVGCDRNAAMEQAREAVEAIGLPVIVRPAFTLAGTGGGIAYNREEFEVIARHGIEQSPVGQILIDESLIGWKEFEMEVIRDKADNCIIVCSIENIDAMGVHTGDSITVAPALTLTDREYQVMRNASIAVLREIGVETGGSNVQFAVNPQTGRLVVIEMNPRVSRSSALASKATGFPIAKVAARLAVGYTLDEIMNDITGVTPASFEPSIDYVVTKIPRFAFEKYPGADDTLTTAMKSVGEAMAIGRTFQESLQKALRSLETGLTGLDDLAVPGLGLGDDRNALLRACARPTPTRLLAVAEALRRGLSIEDVNRVSGFDPWFLRQIAELLAVEADLIAGGLPSTADGLRRIKAMGFSDQRLAKLTGKSELDVRALRHGLNVRPVYKRIDTCAAEFASPTPYLYSTYESGFFGQAPFCEALPTGRAKAMILGGGPNRIGQGIEFDYCCCHAAFAMAELGIESIMVNCNPETVSTDYDTSDRLYFEPLTAEDVLEIVHVEQLAGDLRGLIVQFGGQTPLKLAKSLEAAGAPILGTTPHAIDLAEDRELFARLIDDLGLRQSPSAIARTEEEVLAAAEHIGYPVMLRPSFVLSGRGMQIIRTRAEAERYVREAVRVSGDTPVLVDSYLADAIEVDVDAICDGERAYVAGIMEHIEEAGIHSGDSACALPPYTLSSEIQRRLAEQTRKLALALNVRGLINVQFALKDNEIFVLEANPRASRTVPFVAKAVELPIAALAAKVMAGVSLSTLNPPQPKPRRMAVKEAVFPFARFPGVDPALGPEMRSTGEVMGLDANFGAAFLKSQIAAGTHLPTEGTAFISMRDNDKPAIVATAQDLIALGFRITATSGTADYLRRAGVEVTEVRKVLEGSPHIVDAMKDGLVHLVFNTTEGSQAMVDSASIRRTALLQSIPYYTTLSGARAAVQAIRALKAGPLSVCALQARA